MMQVWDANGDGTIDYREFLAAALSLYQATRGVLPTERALWHNRLRVVFNEIDTNGNGMLSQKELEALIGDKAEVQRALVVRFAACIAGVSVAVRRRRHLAGRLASQDCGFDAHCVLSAQCTSYTH